MAKIGKIALVLSSLAVIGSGVTAYARGSGGFPYERFGDDSVGGSNPTQLTPDQLAAGGAGGAAGSGPGSSTGSGSGTGMGTGSGQTGGASSTGSGSSGTIGTGGNSSGQ
jgi:hypothetical protein